MSIPLIINGNTFEYPETGDTSWGPDATDWAAAVTSGMLQKAGGTFTLTADVNFGANYGIISKYFTSQAANAASAGAVRLASTDVVSWRNNANSGDVSLSKDSSDDLLWNGHIISGSTGIVPVTAGGTGLSSGTSGGILGFTGSTTIASSIALTANQLVIGGGAGATPTPLAAGSQYQVLTMGASNPGYGAVNLAQAAAVTGVLPNGNTTAASANAASAIVARDGSGNFAAGTITGALTGTASGNLVYTPNNHGVLLSGSGNTVTVVAPDSSTAKVLVSGGASADPAWGTVAAAAGGTGQTSYTKGDLLVATGATTLAKLGVGADGALLAADSGQTSGIKWSTTAGTGTVTSVAMTLPSAVFITPPTGSPITTSGTLAVALATQTARTFLQGPQSGSAATPTFAALAVPTVQKFTVNGSTTGYLFTVSSANATVGATYTNNGNTYTVLSTIAAATQLFCSNSSSPAGSGTLTKASGTGDATITFSNASPIATYTPPSNPAPLYLRVRIVGGGGGGSGSGTAGSPAAGGNGTTSAFGNNIANGGAGAAFQTPGTLNAGGTAFLASGSLGTAFTGAAGQGGSFASISTVNLVGGAGGASPLGGQGAQGGSGAAGGAAIANTGSGGGGAGSSGFAGNTWAGSGGGAGGYVECIVPTPISTWYLVGAAGTAGGAGSNGSAGGAGSTGLVIVEEHYQ